MTSRTMLSAAMMASACALAGVFLVHHAFAQQDSDPIADNVKKMMADGRQTFRFETFGDEAFWGDTLKLHKAIEGSKFGGVGSGVSPKAALSLGLKVDAAVLPEDLVSSVKAGTVNLDDPAITLALLKLNAVVGLTGFFNQDGSLKSVGVQCAICHSTVDNSFSAPGIPPGNIGGRLDGWPNRDLNIGAIVAAAPDLSFQANALGVDEATVRKVLMAWGPGKFDAELLLDGKGFRPDGKTSAVLIPPAFGLAGVNLNTWTGWGSTTYWNAFVANVEMHGQGRFWDPRLNDASTFPVAAKLGFGDTTIAPENDRVTTKLAALHFYQLAIPAPKPELNAFDQASAFKAKLGAALFTGKANCARCHVPPLYTEPGWNMRTPAEVCVDDFQASRSPDKHYRTTPLAGLFAHQKGGFFHDGRFATLRDVVDHYNGCMNLRLTNDESDAIVSYLLTL
jgi:hypothetical protein